ncbi:hypothetical protein [Arthrobacter sp. zg-Y769]|uniref:hypothetical protein n=1 Tax=Arthrobacter sp. zg-Y769 TaxID=2894191 RepID=UPI001E282A4D|nr:hypothetical protein [Arthrobacter sp. zg-Y769]MCC9204172.1 hypothetical protein [Arthrobacter sp. zg-Y769]
MDPAGIHATLVDVAADGESLNQAAKDTRASGEKISGAFGTAEVAAAAFNRFWAARDDVGERVASLVFRKAEAVSTAAHAFSQADSDMASTALSKLPATYASPSGGGIRAVK